MEEEAMRQVTHVTHIQKSHGGGAGMLQIWMSHGTHESCHRFIKVMEHVSHLTEL